MRLHFLAVICLCSSLYAQDAPQAPSAELTSAPASSVSAPQEPSVRTTREKWNHFLRETASPLTLGGGVFNAAFSQVTNTDPKYGTNSAAFAERFAASI